MKDLDVARELVRLANCCKRVAFKMNPPKWLDKSQHEEWDKVVEKYGNRPYPVLISIFKNSLKKRGLEMKKTNACDERDACGADEPRDEVLGLGRRARLTRRAENKIDMKSAKEEYPEGIYKEFSINVKLDGDTYMIHCLQWKSEFPGGKKSEQVGDRVKKLVMEIVKHNDEEMSESR